MVAAVSEVMPGVREDEKFIGFLATAGLLPGKLPRVFVNASERWQRDLSHRRRVSCD